MDMGKFGGLATAQTIIDDRLDLCFDEFDADGEVLGPPRMTRCPGVTPWVIKTPENGSVG